MSPPEPWQIDLPSWHDRNWVPNTYNEFGFLIPKPSSIIKDYWKADQSKIRGRIHQTQVFLNEINEDIQDNNKKIKKLENDYNATLNDVHAGTQERHRAQRELALRRYRAGIQKRERLAKALKIEKMKYDAENRGYKRDFPNYWKH